MRLEEGMKKREDLGLEIKRIFYNIVFDSTADCKAGFNVRDKTKKGDLKKQFSGVRKAKIRQTKVGGSFWLKIKNRLPLLRRACPS